jgi:pilus assembly protein CpaE
MHKTLNILLVGRSQQTIAPVSAALENKRILSLATHLAGNGHANPLETGKPLPDALVLVIDADWRTYFLGMAETLSTLRRPFFVVGPTSETELLRAAMRAGARDVFSLPLNVDDFVAAVTQIADEERARSGLPTGHLVTFINAKGGSGASLLAANIAIHMASAKRRKTVLVDLDFQFGGLPTYINMAARDGLIKALELVDTLDDASLQGYTQKHDSGLQVLAAAMEEIILPEEVGRDQVEKLLSVLDETYEEIIIDLPRRIDIMTGTALARADRVVVVAQQTVAHLHDTKRLIFLLRDQLGIPLDRLLLVINRFDKKADVRLRDFASILAGLPIETVPGDYRRVAESINLGVPLCQGTARSALERRLAELAETVLHATPGEQPRTRSLFRWLPRLNDTRG